MKDNKFKAVTNVNDNTEYSLDVFDASSADHDSRMPNVMEGYLSKKIANTLRENKEAIIKPASDFGSMAALSAAAVPAMVPIVNLGAKKVSGQTYNQASREVLDMKVDQLVKQGLQNLKRRSVSSLMPATFSDSVGDELGLNAKERAALNVVAETAIASFVVREGQERFDAVNANKDAAEIAKRSTVYKSNAIPQTAAMAIRNGLFSSAIFMAKPWAKNITDAVVDEDNTESKASVETAITYGIRGFLAFGTAPADRIFTQLSIGNKSFEEVMKDSFKDIKSGNISKLFTGATARTAFCLISASTIAEGLYLSKTIRNSEEEITKVVNDIVKVVESHASKIGRKMAEAFDTLSQDPSKKETDLLSALADAAKKSGQEISKEIAAESKGKASSSVAVSEAKQMAGEAKNKSSGRSSV